MFDHHFSIYNKPNQAPNFGNSIVALLHKCLNAHYGRHTILVSLTSLTAPAPLRPHLTGISQGSDARSRARSADLVRLPIRDFRVGLYARRSIATH